MIFKINGIIMTYSSLSRYLNAILFRVVYLQYSYNVSSRVLWLSKIVEIINILMRYFTILNEGTYVATRLW